MYRVSKTELTVRRLLTNVENMEAGSDLHFKNVTDRPLEFVKGIITQSIALTL